VHDQGYQQQHEEYIEDDLSDASRSAGNSAEAESSRNQSDHQERYSPTKHGKYSFACLFCSVQRVGVSRSFKKKNLRKIGDRHEGGTLAPAILCHQACKPGSVPRRESAAMAIHLERALRRASCNQPGRLI